MFDDSDDEIPLSDIPLRAPAGAASEAPVAPSKPSRRGSAAARSRDDAPATQRCSTREEATGASAGTAALGARRRRRHITRREPADARHGGPPAPALRRDVG